MTHFPKSFKESCELDFSTQVLAMCLVLVASCRSDMLFCLLQQMMNMGGGARRPPPRKIILNVSANEEVQLKKAENAWKPGMKRAGPSDDPEVITTQVGGAKPFI